MHALNVQQACWAVKLSRATYYYQSKAKDDQAIIERIQTHITQNPRHGFDKLYDTLHLTGVPPCGKTRLRRVYGQLKLNLPGRGKRRLPKRIATPLAVPAALQCRMVSRFHE